LIRRIVSLIVCWFAAAGCGGPGRGVVGRVVGGGLVMVYEVVSARRPSESKKSTTRFPATEIFKKGDDRRPTKSFFRQPKFLADESIFSNFGG